MGSAPLTADAGLLLLSAQSQFTDEWSKAAATAAASSNPVPTLEGLLAGSVASKEVVEFARSLAAAVATANHPEGIARVLAAAAKGGNVAVAKVVLREFTERRTAPVADTQALKVLLASSDLELAAGAAPSAFEMARATAGARRAAGFEFSKLITYITILPKCWRRSSADCRAPARSPNYFQGALDARCHGAPGGACGFIWRCVVVEHCPENHEKTTFWAVCPSVAPREADCSRYTASRGLTFAQPVWFGSRYPPMCVVLPIVACEGRAT
jgi:hypothetical protein